MGGTSKQKNLDMLSPQQRQLYNTALEQLGPDFIQSMGSFMQPMDEQQMQDTFQQSYIDPAMKTFNQQVVPGIQERFVGGNAGSSSALNQALASSASDMTTNLGAQYGQFQQQQKANQMGALQQFMPMLGQQTYQPYMQQSPGILPGLLGSVGQGFAGSAGNKFGNWMWPGNQGGQGGQGR